MRLIAIVVFGLAATGATLAGSGLVVWVNATGGADSQQDQSRTTAFGDDVAVADQKDHTERNQRQRQKAAGQG